MWLHLLIHKDLHHLNYTPYSSLSKVFSSFFLSFYTYFSSGSSIFPSLLRDISSLSSSHGTSISDFFSACKYDWGAGNSSSLLEWTTGNFDIFFRLSPSCYSSSSFCFFFCRRVSSSSRLQMTLFISLIYYSLYRWKWTNCEMGSSFSEGF